MFVVDPLGDAEVLDADRADHPLDEVRMREDPSARILNPDATGHVPGVEGAAKVGPTRSTLPYHLTRGGEMVRGSRSA